MPFFMPAIAAMLGGGAAAGAGAGAAAGGGLASMGAGGSMLAGAGASAAGAAGSAGGGFWSKFGDWMGGDEKTGESPLSGLADFGDAMDRRNYAQVQQIPHPVPGGAPNTNPGLFGLQDLVAQSNRGGWGRF